MFPTTVTIHNIADLQKVMSVLYPTTGVIEITDKSRDTTATVDIQAVVNKAEAKVAVGKSKSASAETTASPAPSSPTAVADAGVGAQEKMVAASIRTAGSAEAEQQASTAATDAPAPTYKDAAEAVTGLSRKKGRNAALAVLKTFGAEKLPDVKPEQFADVIAACQAAMGE